MRRPPWITSKNLETKIKLFKELITKKINYQDLEDLQVENDDGNDDNTFVLSTERQMIMIMDIFEAIYEKLEEIKTLIERNDHECGNKRN